MAKVSVSQIVNDGFETIRVILSNGDELVGLTNVHTSGGLHECSTFTLDGYITGQKEEDRNGSE
jgi:hypothetical protein